MEGVGADYGAVEWTIDDFSYWNASLHNEAITSLNFFGELHFEIRPKGGSNPEEIMSVRILGDPRTNVFGNLSLIYSDHYVFCSAEVEIDTQRPVFELSSAPKFKDVMFRSKMKEFLLKDQITLRFQMRGAVSDSVLYMRTEICVHRFFFIIPGEVFFNINLYDLPDQCIQTLPYPSGDSATSKIRVYAGIGGINNSYIVFKMKQTVPRETVFISSRTAFMWPDGTNVGHRVDESVRCTDLGYWTLSSLLERTGIMSMCWRVRVIPENRSELLCTYSTTDPRQNLPNVGLCHSTSNSYVEKPLGNIKAGTSCQPALNVLSNDFTSLYQDQTFSDITLKCDNVTFPVHKNILSARSPVFKTMLSTDMKEAASNEVDIADIDPSTLGHFLTYLYSGAVELQNESALKLYYVGDKYQVPSLKMDCYTFLVVNMSVSNVCDILSLADKHGDGQLTSAAHDFILDNSAAVLRSREWDTLKRSEPILVAETLTQFAVEGHLIRSDFKKRKLTK